MARQAGYAFADYNSAIVMAYRENGVIFPDEMIGDAISSLFDNDQSVYVGNEQDKDKIAQEMSDQELLVAD